MRKKFPRLKDHLIKKLGHPQGGGEQLAFHCPFCLDRTGSESGNPKLHINTGQAKAHCFRCGYSAGGPSKLLADLNGGRLGLTERAVLEGIPDEGSAQYGSVRDTVLVHLFASAETHIDTLKPRKLPAEYRPLWKVDRRKRIPVALRPAFRYLDRRGITAEQIKRHQIGYCVEGREAHYLIFPIHLAGKQVCYTTRYAGDADAHSRPKSLDPKVEEGLYSKGDCLLGFDECKGCDEVNIVEGPFDYMAAFPAIAMLGKELTDAQMALIGLLAQPRKGQHRRLRRVNVILDSDATSHGIEIFDRLKPIVPTRFVDLRDGDPDELRGELSQIIEQSPDSLSVSRRVKAIMGASA